MKKKIIVIFVVIITIAAAGLWFFNKEKIGETPIKASYLCNEGKTMEVSFYNGEPLVVNPGEPPIPTGRVDLILSDGRQMNLPQTISASGVRYANQDESFVFWSKGNGALVLESNTEKSYIGCIVLASDPGGLPNAYSNAGSGFSVRYPEGYAVNTEYKYQSLGPGKDIYGVKFTIPASLAEGKNLSSFDTGVSIEAILAVDDCRADLFLSHQEIESQRITDSTNVEYTVAFSNEGAAGNRYEERVWALTGTNPCVGVRYFIHSTNIENYEPGTIEQFDPRDFLEDFDKIRQSLVVE
jgi:membrane-bound inhibitor of C-type lysozyme